MLCLRSEMEYDQRLIEMNQRLAYQGVLNNCKNVGITETEIQQAQAPLNPSIRRYCLFQTYHSDWYVTTNISSPTTIQVTKPCHQPSLSR